MAHVDQDADLGHERVAVDVHDLAVDPLAFIREQERDEGRDVIGFAHPRTADALERGGLQFWPLRRGPDGLGGGETRGDGVAADAVLAPPGGDMSCQRADSGLGGGVGRAGRFTLEGGRRGHVDDGAAATGEHLRDGVLHRGDVAAQIHRHHAIPHVEVDVDHVGVAPNCAHVGADAEQGVDAAVGIDRGCDEVSHRVGVGEVEGARRLPYPHRRRSPRQSVGQPPWRRHRRPPERLRRRVVRRSPRRCQSHHLPRRPPCPANPRKLTRCSFCRHFPRRHFTSMVLEYEL